MKPEPQPPLWFAALAVVAMAVIASWPHLLRVLMRVLVVAATAGLLASCAGYDSKYTLSLEDRLGRRASVSVDIKHASK